MKSKKGLWVTIVILIMCVLGLGSYVVYDKFFNENEVNCNKETEKDKVNEEKNNGDEKFGTESNNSNLSKEDIDKLGVMLFSKINVNDGWSIFGHYPLIENYVDEWMMNYLLFQILGEGKINIKRSYNEFFYIDKDGAIKKTRECSPETKDAECILFSINKDIYIGEYYNLFGINSVIDFSKSVSFYNNLGNGECFFEEDSLVCYADTNDGGIGDDASCYGRYTLYNTVLDGDVIVLHVKPEAYYCESDIDPVEYAKKYSSEYKIKFKQDITGNWYWVSSEEVKK